MNRKLTIATGTVFTLIFLGCLGKDKERECWLERNDVWGECYDDYVNSLLLADSNEAAISICVDTFEECAETADDLAIECGGEDGCIDVYTGCWWDCQDECEDAGDGSCWDSCSDECEDELELCADWWARDCETDCNDDMDDCVNEAAANFTSLEQLYTDVRECAEDLYDDCIPGCYETE